MGHQGGVLDRFGSDLVAISVALRYFNACDFTMFKSPWFREVLNGVGADGVGVIFPIFSVNCSCPRRRWENEEKRKEEKKKKSEENRKHWKKKHEKRGKNEKIPPTPSTSTPLRTRPMIARSKPLGHWGSWHNTLLRIALWISGATRGTKGPSEALERALSPRFVLNEVGKRRRVVSRMGLLRPSVGISRKFGDQHETCVVGLPARRPQNPVTLDGPCLATGKRIPADREPEVLQ